MKNAALKFLPDLSQMKCPVNTRTDWSDETGQPRNETNIYTLEKHI